MRGRPTHAITGSFALAFSLGSQVSFKMGRVVLASGLNLSLRENLVVAWAGEGPGKAHARAARPTRQATWVERQDGYANTFPDDLCTSSVIEQSVDASWAALSDLLA